MSLATTTSTRAVCQGCDRLTPGGQLPEPVDAIMHCAGCHVPFTLDEITALFHEFNLHNDNSSRSVRRQIVEDLITALRKAGRS